MAFTPNRGLRRRSTAAQRLRRKLPGGVRLRALLLGLAALAVMAALVVYAKYRPEPLDPLVARREVAVSAALLARSNATAARSHAFKATRADPAYGLAQVVLARAHLALGQGSAAEAALNRAKMAGFDGRRLRQFYAHAWLLQGDARRALAEAGRVPAPYGAYAMRVKAQALAALGNRAGAQKILLGLAQKKPGAGAATWVALGDVRLASGDVLGAMGAVDRALALKPGDVDALLLKAKLVRGQYGLLGALPWFEAALRVDPWRHAALVEYAATLGDAGRYRAMLAATRRALAAEPGSPQALYLQAVMAARADNVELARALLARTGGVFAGVPGPMLLGGMLDYAEGAYQQAAAKWRAVLGRQPMNLPARRLLGAALYRLGDARGALEVLRPLALRSDADSYTLTLVARSFEQTGERGWAARFLDRAAIPAIADAKPFGADEPLAALQMAAERAAADPVLMVTYIRGLIDAGQGREALARAQQLVRAYPGAPVAQMLVGDVLVGQNRLADANAAYTRAANMRFDEPVMLRLVSGLDRVGRRAQAATALGLFLSQNPQNIAAQRMTAHWQIASGGWAGAIDTLEGLRARLGNGDAALLAELANAYAGNDELETAQVYAAAAYRLAPLNPVTADAYGWALYLAGDIAGGTELMEKAVAIAPAHGGLRWHLAQAYAAAGRGRAARGAIATAMADPGFADRAAAGALLKTLG